MALGSALKHDADYEDITAKLKRQKTGAPDSAFTTPSKQMGQLSMDSDKKPGQ